VVALAARVDLSAVLISLHGMSMGEIIAEGYIGGGCRRPLY
jgi:hypothetical protein